MNNAPYNILVGPLRIYRADYGTAFPDFYEPEADFAVDWLKVGASLDRDYDEDGVSIGSSQTLDEHRFAGTTGPRKITRSEEGLMVGVTVNDMGFDTMGLAFGQEPAAIAGVTDASPAGREVGLYRGFDVPVIALLVCGYSPQFDGPGRYEIPACVVGGEPEIVGNKTDPQGLAFEFIVLEDEGAATPAERFGRFVAQTAALVTGGG